MSRQELYLEPMTTGMILDRSFRLYVQNFALMIGFTAILHLPLLLLTIGLLFLRGENPLQALLVVLIGGLGTLFTTVVVSPLITGATTKAVSEKYLGNDVTALSALRHAWSFIWTLLIIQVVAGLIIIGGLFLLVVPGVLWMLSYSLVTPVAVLEHNRDGAVVRRRSWYLVAGNRGKVFAIIMLVALVQLLLAGTGSLIGYLSFGPESEMNNIFWQVSSNLAGMAIYPLQAIAITLLYYDFRIRKEGFDLEMLSRAIGSPRTPR